MNYLREEIGDVHVEAMEAIRAKSNQLKQSLYEPLQPLKDALYNWPNTAEMKRLQSEQTIKHIKKAINDQINRWRNDLLRMQNAVVSDTWSRAAVNFLKKVAHKISGIVINQISNRLLT